MVSDKPKIIINQYGKILGYKQKAAALGHCNFFRARIVLNFGTT